MTKRFGLVGYPLNNSFSVNYFTEKFRSLGLADHVFENFPMQDIAAFPGLINAYPNLCGFTVTIPHKVSILPYLDELDESARQTGAVNCVQIVRDKQSGTLKKIGHNTDVFGFEQSLLSFIPHFDGQALILGTGGAARAVAYVLDKLHIGFCSVSRNAPKGSVRMLSYQELTQTVIDDHRLIINCTPVGMYPHVDEAPPFPYSYISPQHLAFDLVYLPEETVFLKHFRERGARTRNGLDMLHLQADKAWEIFSESPKLKA
jgi:shikimate dehydrogenase